MISHSNHLVTEEKFQHRKVSILNKMMIIRIIIIIVRIEWRTRISNKIYANSPDQWATPKTMSLDKRKLGDQRSDAKSDNM